MAKVHRDVEDYEDLPKSLVKDKPVFNGNYRSANEDIGEEEGFTILYDWKVWEFSSVYIFRCDSISSHTL